MLGLRVWGKQGGLVWRRDNKVSDLSSEIMRWTVFSYCSKLMGRYPVCGWLQVATAVMKRRVNHLTVRWDEIIASEKLRRFLRFWMKSGRMTQCKDDGM